MPQWSNSMSYWMWRGAFLGIWLFVIGGSQAADLGSIPGGKSHLAKFDGDKVHYVTLGKGSTTLVLVHGWSGNISLWREQVPALADKAKLILIDLPGHGESAKPKTDYTCRPDWTLAKVSIPVIMINAPNPRWTEDYAYVRGVSPRAEYRVLEGTHHCLMLEKPAEFNAILVLVLRKHRLLQ